MLRVSKRLQKNGLVAFPMRCAFFKTFSLALWLVLGLLFVSIPELTGLRLAAQDASAAANPPKTSGAAPQPSPTEEPEAETVLKHDVNLVNIFFNVKDKHGALVPNLTKDDFQLFEDGKLQTTKFFSVEADQPLTLGIMIDTSPS